VSPADTLGLVGVTAILTSVGAVTVSVSLGLTTDPTVAVIFVLPVASEVAKPVELLVATLGLLEDHCTPEVSAAVDPSVNVPVAVNCCVSPLATLGLVGVIAMLTSAAVVTVVNTLFGLVTDPIVAVMFALPMVTAPANPLALIMTTLVLLENHDALGVISAVDPSV